MIPLAGTCDSFFTERRNSISLIQDTCLNTYETKFNMYAPGLLKASFTLLISTVYAHSWIEQLMVIGSNGTFVGEPGYARGNVLRTSPGFSDTAMVHLIPPNGRKDVNKVLPTDKMCKESQQSQNQTKGSPRLQASPGAAIALRYQENGHVTLPENSPGKPDNRGTIYVYGTDKPKDDDTLLGIHKVWNQDGSGGDKRGKLLSVQNFDDGRCHQINGGKISKTRQHEFPHKADKLMGADLWCQQDIALPQDAPSGKPYTLYWVWDWPTKPGTPGMPKGKTEIYTTCMDVDVSEKAPNTKVQGPAGYIKDQSLNSAAIPSQFEALSGSGGSQSSATSSSSTNTDAAVTKRSFQTGQATTFLTSAKTASDEPCTSGMSSH